MNVIVIRGEYELRQGFHYEYDRDGVPLGQGGMGRIFEGFSVNDITGQYTTVAIKEINEEMAGNQELIERAMREASVQIDHENLLRMYGFIPNQEYSVLTGTPVIRYYMVMERLVGVNLDQVLTGNVRDKSGMVVPYAEQLYKTYYSDKPKAILEIMRGVLSGIQALHNHGYIHRDIDPSNVMVTTDGRIKVIDFGVCKRIGSSTNEKEGLTQIGSFIGKVNYAPPELATGAVENQNCTSDVYELGVMLFQLATGHLPFSGTNQEIMSAQLVKPLPVREIDNRIIREVVERATQKNQAARYASASEMLADLERLEKKGGKENSVRSTSSSVSIPSWLFAVSAILGLVIGVVLHFILVQ